MVGAGCGSMPAEYVAVAFSVAAGVAKRMCRRSRNNDFDDLRAEALWLCVKAYRECASSPEGVLGVKPFAVLCRIHCYRRLVTYTMRQGSPVTCLDDKRLRDLSVISYVSLDAPAKMSEKAEGARGSGVGSFAAELTSTTTITPSNETDIAVARCRSKLHARVGVMSRRRGWDARVISAIWLDGEDALDVSARLGLDRKQVDLQSRAFRVCYRSDAVLMSLVAAWAEARGLLPDSLPAQKSA